MTTVYLIRHGETDWNVAGRWQGHADQPLNLLGLQQARRLAERLKNERMTFDAIYSSDLRRAFQTAWEIGRATGTAVELFPPLREIDLGTWSGLMSHEIAARFPVEFALLEAGHDIPRGGAESMSMMKQRVSTAIEALLTKLPAERVALVTHGGPVRAMLLHAGYEQSWNIHIGNTSISILQYAQGNWSIERVNDMQHLEGMAQAVDMMAPRDDAQVR